MSTNKVWLGLLSDVLNPLKAVPSSPRGIPTWELPYPHVLGPIDMKDPILSIPERKLNYAFMAAEAGWILSGSDRLEVLTAFCENMAKYSDDGLTLYGAYGPRVNAQFDYVVGTLLKDRHSRQAVMTLWRPNPNPSKDIPCTISLQFMLRDGKLRLIAYMRSSDVWLGVPYDIFTFSMIAYAVVAELNRWMNLQYESLIDVDSLYMLAGSRHLYHENVDKARSLLSGTIGVDSTLPVYPSFAPTLRREALYRHLMARAVMIKTNTATHP